MFAVIEKKHVDSPKWTDEPEAWFVPQCPSERTACFWGRFLYLLVIRTVLTTTNIWCHYMWWTLRNIPYLYIHVSKLWTKRGRTSMTRRKAKLKAEQYSTILSVTDQPGLYAPDRTVPWAAALIRRLNENNICRWPEKSYGLRRTSKTRMQDQRTKIKGEPNSCCLD